jgi:superfamily I DNA/RNA helicase
MFSEWAKHPMPLMPPNPNNGWQNIDWANVLQIIAAINITKESKILPYLIIDEGQDMPPEFYEALVNLGFENFYVVADQNQQIISGSNSSRQDIENTLAIATKDVIELTENYRNSYPTARLAREFYTGDPASPPPELPSMQRTAKRPLLVEYGNSCQANFASVISAILKTADRDPGKLLGVIAPNNDIRQRYVNALSTASLKLDNEKPQIRTYQSGANAAELAFDEGGIILINAQSCKGLEFDIVFLADIDQHYCSPQIQDEKKRLFYVMVARARENVIMLKNADNHCPVDTIIPNNQDILEIRR